jgi:DNA polymerase III epsilon subunit
MSASTVRKVSISVQATGPSSEAGDRVVEIGVAEFSDDGLGARGFHVYLDPQRRLSEKTVARTGLTDEFLGDKPTFAAIARELLEFIAGADLVVYDAVQAVSFLNQELLRVDQGSLSVHVCSVTDLLVAAGQRHPNADNSFASLCTRYFVDTSQRVAFGALRTAELVARLSIRLSSSGVGRALAQQDRSAEVTVSSFGEFVEQTDGISRTCLCRGVSDKDFLLWPSLFRTLGDKHPDLVEHNLLWMFKTHARGILDRVPSNEIEWLTVAQHHGLPTRLLDWSLSPLVAAFFAIESLSPTDGAVFLLELGKFKQEDEIDLSNLSEIVAFFPSHASRRIAAQSGVFTIHPTSATTLDPAGLKQIIIPAKFKLAFREKLFKLGIHRATLFPDLDGLSSHLRFLNGY